jgi:phytol kinase
MKTAVGLVGAAAVAIMLLVLSEAATRKWLLRPETGRKLAHMSSGVLAATFPLYLPFWAIDGLAVAFIPFMLASRHLKLFPVLQRAERSTLGEVYFPAGVVLAAVLVPHKAEYVFGVLVMGIGDAVASLVGERFGRRTYRVTTKKSYIGSASLFITTMILGLSTLAVLGRLSAGNAFIVSAIAAAVSVEEGVVGGGADNVVLPVTAAVMFRLFL